MVLLGGACLYILTFVGAAIARVSFPYPLEITEGASLEAVRGILRGQPLYAPPTVEHVPMIYGPVYFYAAAVVSLVTGPSLAALRLVSLLASLGSIALAYQLVKTETDSRTAGVVAVGVLAATYPLSDGALDLGRVDALVLCLLLGSLAASRRIERWRGAATAGACMGLAVMTKQAAIPVALALCAYFAVGDRARLIPYLASLVVAVGIPLAMLEVQSGHWATLFLIQLPRQHELSELRVGLFWVQAVLPRLTLALVLGMLFWLGRLRDGQWRTAMFYALMTCSMLGVSWASDANQGAAPNVLLPAYGMLAILFALGLHELLKLLSRFRDPRDSFWAYGIGLGIFQLVLLVYNPRLMVPLRSDAWADARLAATLGSLPGTLFAPDFDTFLSGAGQPEQPFLGSAAELLGGYGGASVAAGDMWLAVVRTRLQQRAYDHVVLDPDSPLFFAKGTALDAGYADAGPLFGAGDEFWLWRGGRTPRAEVYVPREHLDDASSR